MTRDFQLPGRSPVIACEGMAAMLASAGDAGRHRDAARRRQRGRRRGRRGRGAVRGRAAHDRHRRRLLLHARRAGQAGLGLQRLRPRRRPRVDRGAAGAGHPRHRAGLDPRRDRAGCDRCLGGDPRGARPLRARPRARARHPLRRAADFRWRRASPGTGRGWSASCATIPARRAISCSTAARRRKATSSGCRRWRRRCETIAAKGPRAFYEGPIARGHGRDRRRARLLPHRRGFRRSSRRRGRADHHQLSRSRCPRVAAQRPGPDRAGAAQHPGALRSRRARSARPRPLPHRARSGAARLCGARHPPRRSRRTCARRCRR